jgi:RHS repeat-associated protein
MTDGTGQSSYDYYDDGTLQTETDGAGHSIGYHYNADGNPKIITYPNGHNLTIGYNQGQQVKAITDWNDNQTQFGYDGDGHLTSQAAPNGDTATTSYNTASQLTDITDKNAAHTTLADFAYTPGANGETRAATTSGTAITAPDQTYSYNSLGQLTGVNNANYSYNLAGDPVALGDPIFTQGFGGADQIIGHEIDSTSGVNYDFNARGDRTTATAAPSGNTTSYAYDQANHLTSYTPPTGPATSYAYNGHGLRTSKTTSGDTTSYTWDTAGSLPLMLTAGNTSYIYGPDGLPIESVKADGTATYLFHDQIGSTRLLTDPAGNVTGTYTYDAWGNTTSHTGTATTPLQYTGQYRDDETGFYYLRTRYYGPYTAQFLTVDPIVGQTRATYTYAGNNPITGTDPTGLSNELVGGGGARYVDPVAYASYKRSEGGWKDILGGAVNALYGPARSVIVFSSFAEGPEAGLAANRSLPERIPIGNSHTSSYAAGGIYGTLATLAIPGGGGDMLRAGTGIMDKLAADAGSDAARTLFHYTDEAGQKGILDSGQLNPSLRELNPSDARYGNGQYLSDVKPGTMTSNQLSRAFLGAPFWGSRFTNFLEIDVSGLNVVQGRAGVFLIPNEGQLQLAGRIVSWGTN